MLHITNTMVKELVGYNIYDRYKKVGYVGIIPFRTDKETWVNKYDPSKFTWVERWI